MERTAPIIKRTRNYLITLGIIVVVAFLGFKYSSERSNSTSAISSFEETSDVGDTSIYFTVENDYTKELGPIARQYSWVSTDTIVIDTLKEATLTVVDENAVDDTTYMWTIDGEIISGDSITYTFSKIMSYTVILQKIVPGEDLETYTGTVSSKYVRRELRQLSDDDRNTFLDTMQVLYNVAQDQGESLYGSDYMSMEKLVMVHLELAGDSECDHLHDGLGFLTQHSALTNMFEKSLQAVNPTVR